MCVARLQQGGHSLSRMSREIVAAYWQDKGRFVSLTLAVTYTVRSCVYQEDRVVCLQELPGSSKISSFFAVYDGHGGFKASQYCMLSSNGFVMYLNHTEYVIPESKKLTGRETPTICRPKARTA